MGERHLLINLTFREDIVVIYHDMFKGTGEFKHIYVEINVVLAICGCSKTFSVKLYKLFHYNQ